MKTNLRKLNLLSRFIDFSMFYCIDINKWGYIKLQGVATQETLKRLNKLFDLTYNYEWGWFEARRNEINVVLTLPESIQLKYH